MLSNAEYLIGQAQTPAGPARGHVYAESVGSNIYVAEVSVQRESVLKHKSTYHPNWHAYVDDVEAKTVMLMPSYIGVKLALGDHTVRMEYRPRQLRAILLFVGLSVLALIALVERHRERITPWLTGLISGRLAALKKGLAAEKSGADRFLDPIGPKYPDTVEQNGWPGG